MDTSAHPVPHALCVSPVPGPPLRPRTIRYYGVAHLLCIRDHPRVTQAWTGLSMSSGVKTDVLVSLVLSLSYGREVQPSTSSRSRHERVCSSDCLKRPLPAWAMLAGAVAGDRPVGRIRCATRRSAGAGIPRPELLTAPSYALPDAAGGPSRRRLVSCRIATHGGAPLAGNGRDAGLLGHVIIDAKSGCRRGQGRDRAHAFLREPRQRGGIRDLQPPAHLK